jgi:hypothetical protein
MWTCVNNFHWIKNYRLIFTEPLSSRTKDFNHVTLTEILNLYSPRISLIAWLWWGETMSQNCSHQQAYRSSPGDMWAWKAMMMMMAAGDNTWLIHQSSMAVLLAETSGASRRNGRRSENFAYQYPKYLKGSLKFCKILMAWDLRLYFPSKGRCAADFYHP